MHNFLRPDRGWNLWAVGCTCMYIGRMCFNELCGRGVFKVKVALRICI